MTTQSHRRALPSWKEDELTAGARARQRSDPDRRHHGARPTGQAARVLELQQTAGNRAVATLLGDQRSRTGEETVIDLVGTGSALNSLVKSPGQTVGNAFKGLVSGFPSRSTIQKQPVVKAAIDQAWSAAKSDYCERFGWITWDKKTKTYFVRDANKSVGTPWSCTPPTKPADPDPKAKLQEFHVGEFHIHPPLDPSDPGMQDPTQLPIGPSDQDESIAQTDHSPGIVRDFTTIKRDKGTTDYTYGPWTRT
jgi:hypothetical protein